MTEPANESITRWIANLKQGDDEAARRLWERYFHRLVQLARLKLGTTARRVADEEDMALSVFRRLCDGAKDGRFEQLADRDDLWRLLVVITTNRVIDQQRHLSPQKRGDGHVRGDSAFIGASSEAAGLENLIGDDPTPEMLLQISEEHERLMTALDEDLRQIAVWKMESRNNEEIARELGITSRSVRRKLARIRELWLVEAEA